MLNNRKYTTQRTYFCISSISLEVEYFRNFRQFKTTITKMTLIISLDFTQPITSRSRDISDVVFFSETLTKFLRMANHKQNNKKWQYTGYHISNYKTLFTHNTIQQIHKQTQAYRDIKTHYLEIHFPYASFKCANLTTDRSKIFLGGVNTLCLSLHLAYFLSVFNYQPYKVIPSHPKPSEPPTHSASSIRTTVWIYIAPANTINSS